MLTYAFRWKINRKIQTVGIVVAQNLQDLFWELDQYADPFAVELKEISTGSMLWTEDAKTNDIKCPESFMDWGGRGWFKAYDIFQEGWDSDDI